MRRSFLLDALKLIAVFGLIWLGFTFIPKLIPDKNPLELSVESEEKLGKLVVDNLIKEDKNIRIIHNPTIDSAVAEITSRLVNAIGQTEYEYKIEVIESQEVNAFTLPGGYIFIYSGLIDLAGGPEEVAAVLSHEIGHAEKRHVVSKLIKELGITFLFSILAGDGGVLLSEVGRTALSSVFDRSQEREADDFGLQLLERASVEPKAMAVFFRKVRDKFGNKYEELEILMTHPNNNSRIKAAFEFKTSKSFAPKAFNCDWNRVKNSLNYNGAE